MTQCYLSIDFEDYCHDLQRALGVDAPSTRGQPLQKAYDRLMEIVSRAPGANDVTFFTTGQVARDHPELLAGMAGDGHEIGCHSYYHDSISKMGRERFADALDRAIEVTSAASGQPVRGFRAPDFSIDPRDSWAYEELAKRFDYDSSFVTENRSNTDVATDEMVFGEHRLAEFPVFRNELMPKFNVRVIGGTYMKLLPLATIRKLMHEAIGKGFVPLIYLHPYEMLHEGEFWVKRQDLPGVPASTVAYWQIRQHQWLTIGNLGIMRKLKALLEEFPHAGTMAGAFDRG